MLEPASWLPCVRGSVTERRRGRIQRGEAGAAVEKREDGRQPEAFFGHRKRSVGAAD